MKKVLFLFFFLISCTASTSSSSSTELEPNSEEESVIVTNTTLSTNDTHDDHDHHDDHEEEAHDDHDEETPKPIDLLPFDYYLIVPDGVPDKLEVLNYNLGEETVIHFEVRDVEKELNDAKKHWKIKYRLVTSETNKESKILIVEGLDKK